MPQFILTHYEDDSNHSDLDQGHPSKESHVFKYTGITSLTPSQFDCFCQLQMKFSSSCLLLFASWVEEGFYDFCSVPFSLKIHMNDLDRAAICELKDKWTGSAHDLLKEVKQLIDVMRHSEDDIIKSVHRHTQVSKNSI